MKYTYLRNDIKIISNEELNEHLQDKYIEYIRGKNIEGSLEEIKLNFENDDVEISYILEPIKLDRIRRITGYLVGTVDRFNDGKKAEEHDRVKHNCN